MEANAANVEVKSQEVIKSPSGFSIIWRELVRDKLALISLIFLIGITIFVYGVSIVLNQEEIVKVDLLAIY